MLRELAAAASSLPAENERARGLRLRAALARFTLPSVTLSIPELGTLTGHDEIASAFERAGGFGLRISIEQSDVRVRADRADATLRVSFIVKNPSEEWRQLRTVTVDLVRRGEGFAISQASVSARSDDPAEARP